MGSLQTLHVLDLPALYTKPDAEALLSALNRLRLRPFDFSGSDPAKYEDDLLHIHGNVPEWLTNIIKSKLAWLHDEEREQIWDETSTRLAERAGQMGQTSSHRKFRIPRPLYDGISTADDLEITLYEPAVVGDNLGTKTWGSAYLMAANLVELASHVPHLHARCKGLYDTSAMPSSRVLELGAGTGLVGIAAAMLLEADVTVSDLEGPVLDNLRKNADSNRDGTKRKGSAPCRLNCRPLDWSTAPTAQELPEQNRYNVILAADPVYDTEHPAVLANAVDAFLSKSVDARFIVELPKRSGFQDIRAALYKELDDHDLVRIARGIHLGRDEWGADRDSEKREHEWAVFKRDLA